MFPTHYAIEALRHPDDGFGWFFWPPESWNYPRWRMKWRRNLALRRLRREKGGKYEFRKAEDGDGEFHAESFEDG